MSNTRQATRALRAAPPRAFVQEDGSVVYEVPSKAVTRLLQLGVHAERESRRRIMQRREARAARRRNRSTK